MPVHSSERKRELIDIFAVHGTDGIVYHQCFPNAIAARESIQDYCYNENKKSYMDAKSSAHAKTFKCKDPMEKCEWEVRVCKVANNKFMRVTFANLEHRDMCPTLARASQRQLLLLSSVTSAVNNFGKATMNEVHAQACTTGGVKGGSDAMWFRMKVSSASSPGRGSQRAAHS